LGGGRPGQSQKTTQEGEQDQALPKWFLVIQYIFGSSGKFFL
jgi:hypothetical protein